MEPLTLATSFATIIGLIGNYRSERSGKHLDDFMEWLRESHKEDMETAIRSNRELSDQISSVLAINQEEILKLLKRLDLALSSTALRIPEFNGLAKAIHSDIEISGQAISILRQFVNSGAKRIVERKQMTGEADKYHFHDGGHGILEYNEPRFIEDDFSFLSESGFLRKDESRKNNRCFLITRSAVEFVRTVEETL